MKKIEIQVNSFPSYYSWLRTTYENITWIWYRQGKLAEALEYMKKAYEMNVKKLTHDHERLKQCQQWIVRLEEKLSQVEEKTH
ncbi:unnamed protein product [Rotaria sp. Silwood2]|nr:unnamed protein product [Rotaria sp. Silwood2]CAF3487001.1 unnamed protein product [Rotaria sp. Silwood2]CAF4103598.1 unnamed protein product [Rotaria sp. Silwood2]